MQRRDFIHDALTRLVRTCPCLPRPRSPHAVGPSMTGNGPPVVGGKEHDIV